MTYFRKLTSRRLLLLLAFLLAAKGLVLLADSAPSFQFGDSGSYLATAIMKWIPADRSFFYGFVLRPLILATHSLWPMVVGQALLSGIASWLVGVCLFRYFETSFVMAAVAAFACALEPLQLMFERFAMTEAMATFAFAVWFFFCLYFLQTGKWWSLAWLGVVGTLLVGFRFSFLPLVIVISVVLPFLAPGWSAKRIGLLLGQLGLSVLTSQAGLYGYRHLYGHVVHEPPAYLSRDGDFLLADFSPLVRPADFPIAAKRDQVFANVTIPRTIKNRLITRWWPGGLCEAVLKAADNNEYEANRWARKTAVSAMKRDPAGVLRLGVLTYFQFFDREDIQHNLLLDQGQFVDPGPVQIDMLKAATSIDLSHRTFDSLTKRWEASATFWCWLVIVIPPIHTIVLCIRRRVLRRELLCLLCSWILLAGAVLPTEMANPRYLIPLTWLTFISLASMFARRTEPAA